MILSALTAVLISAAGPAYGIVIGVNEAPAAEPELDALRYADDDAVRWYQLLGRFAGDVRLFSVLDTGTQRRYPELAQRAEAPRLDPVLRAVDELAQEIAEDVARGEQPVFYFVFSGHGARGKDGSAYLTLHDAELTRSVLYGRILSKIPARFIHLIVDACHARGVVGLRGEFAVELDTEHEARSATVTASVFPEPSSLPALGVMVATTEGNQAHEWSEIEAGVFTHEMLSGLLGAADVNGDARIEYTELEAFVASASRNLRDPRAVPKVVAVPPMLDRRAPLISLSSIDDRATLVGDAEKLGHFHLELANGQRYLDANLSRELPLSVLLPENSDLYVRTGGQEAEVRAVAAGEKVDLAELVFQPRSDKTRGSIDRAYREGLFAAPYSASYYRGFIDRAGAVGVPLTAGFDREEERTETLGKTLAIGAGVATALAIATAVIAVNARSDFDNTSLQAPAHAAADRLELHSRVSAVSGGVAVGLALGAWLTWP